MRALVIALTILASPASAAEFRGSELGGQCALVHRHEAALRSVEIAHGSQEEQHRFAGLAFDRHATITYLCKEGQLTLIDDHFQKGAYDDVIPEFRWRLFKSFGYVRGAGTFMKSAIGKPLSMEPRLGAIQPYGKARGFT